MANTKVDVLQAVMDEKYAAQITQEQWNVLSQDPAWRDLATEVPELTAPLYARFGLQPSGNPAVNPTLAADTFNVVGKRLPRTHGIGVVTSVGKFSQHIITENMVFMKVLGSKHPHAKVLKVDTSKAEKLPGVVSIMHRGNMPKEYADVTLGAGPPARFIFGEEVYQVGAPVAAVVAETEHIADEAMRMIEVQYQVLPAVFDMIDATKSNTAKQWDSKLDGTTLAIAQPFVRGNGDQGLTQGDVVVQSVSNRGFEDHVALELGNSISWWDNNKLNHIGTVRHPHGRRASLAQWLKIPQNQVRIISPGYLGSSYGSKRDPDWADIIAALMAKVVGRPVKAIASRSEDLVIRTHRAQSRTEAKMSVKRDGTIVGATFKVTSNVGAARLAAATGSWIGFQQMYKIPNLKLEGIDVFTNMYRYGSYRCVQHPVATLSQEILIDKAAYAINMNPLDIRLKNINEAGNPDTKKPYSNPSSIACLQKAAEMIGWKAKWHAPKAKEVRPGVFHGIGIASHTCSHGAGGAPSTGSVVINADGTLSIVSAAAEVGPGERTIMAMIGSEALGIPYEQTTISPDVDTDFTSDTGNTAGSRQTISGGWGIYEAAIDARQQVLYWAALRFVANARAATPPQTITVKVEDLDIVKGVVVMKSDPTKTLKMADVVAAAANPIIGRGAHLHEATWERMSFASHAVEVEVDTVTGSVKILKYVAVHDVGRAINPMGVEQQIEGGAIMGIGAALFEENLVDAATGLPINDNILDYKLMSMKDIPRSIDVGILEYPKAFGTYGAMGIGEPPIALPGPVIANAIYNAVGAWVESMPFTRVKLLAALKTA